VRGLKKEKKNQRSQKEGGSRPGKMKRGRTGVTLNDNSDQETDQQGGGGPTGTI